MKNCLLCAVVALFCLAPTAALAQQKELDHETQQHDAIKRVDTTTQSLGDIVVALQSDVQTYKVMTITAIALAVILLIVLLMRKQGKVMTDEQAQRLIIEQMGLFASRLYDLEGQLKTGDVFELAARRAFDGQAANPQPTSNKELENIAKTIVKTCGQMIQGSEGRIVAALGQNAEEWAERQKTIRKKLNALLERPEGIDPSELEENLQALVDQLGETAQAQAEAMRRLSADPPTSP